MKQPHLAFFCEQPHPTSPDREECKILVDAVLCQEEGVPSGVGGWSKKNKRIFVEYNRGYIEYAKENRRFSTYVERLFRWIARNRKLLGYKFKRQKTIWPFILDFYCSELLLWVELDGGYHNETVGYDRQRDAEIYKKGVLVVRFRNEDIERNLWWVISELEEIIKERHKILNS